MSLSPPAVVLSTALQGADLCVSHRNLCPKCPTGPRQCQHHHVLLKVGKSEMEVQPRLECLQHSLCCGLGPGGISSRGVFFMET